MWNDWNKQCDFMQPLALDLFDVQKNNDLIQIEPVTAAAAAACNRRCVKCDITW